MLDVAEAIRGYRLAIADHYRALAMVCELLGHLTKAEELLAMAQEIEEDARISSIQQISGSLASTPPAPPESLYPS